MCGIFGILSFNAHVPEDLLERATLSLAHRGPDDHGTVILRDHKNPSLEVGLGNRRLAILDLSPLGHQPMRDPATGNWIVYNGEVYNFRDIRAKLETAGVSFSSATDTEVVLKAYGLWGSQCLAEFRGMFAFAIWDAQRQRLFMARDPMGIKPLYYFGSDRCFMFSSEVRTLLGTGLVPRRVDSAGLMNYLQFGSVCDPNTLIEGITSLPSASYLTWQEGQIERVHYWDLDGGDIDQAHFSLDSSKTTRTSVEVKIAEMLDESVRMQIISDVPVGVFLSGGIDSSALVGILSRNSVRPSTFSIVFQEAAYSEAEYSRAVASHFRTDHHEITVSQDDFLATAEPAIRAMDLPTIDGLNTYFVSERTREAGVKVALSGLGGDELFAGYSSFRTVPRMERFANSWKRVPAVIQSFLASLFGALVPANDQNRKLAAFVHLAGEKIHPYFISRMLFATEQQNRLMPSVAVDPAIRLRAELYLTENLRNALKLDPINRVSYLETTCYMVNMLLRDSDCMSMAHGLEIRVPLIDHHLAKRVLSISGSWKIDPFTPKPLLVKALAGQLPDKIVHRPKRGFTMPFDQWLRGTMRPNIAAAFARMESGPLSPKIDPEEVHRVWQGFLCGKTSWSRPWALYVLQRWCEHNEVTG